MVRDEIHSLDMNLPVYKVKTMSQVLSGAAAQPRFLATLLLVFAGLALVLATVGIYGVMAYIVAQNTREIGIRIALGAQPKNILKMILRRGLVLTLSGIAFGVAGSFALTRVISSSLFGVSPTDPITFVLVSLILISVAMIACYIPARRATKTDPMVALRYE
jgi:putative ABC transport system permease protein